MPFLPGTSRGLDGCANVHGTFAVLALDHRQNLRRELHPEDPSAATYAEMVEFKRAVVRALATAATGVLLDPEVGAAQCVVDGSLPGSVGLIVALEATGYGGPAGARESRILAGWSVAKVRRMGASAAKLLVYYNPDAPNAGGQERLVTEVAEACRAADLALFLEPLSFSLEPGAKLGGDERRRVVVETARRLTALGGDVLKAEFPYDAAVRDHARWAEACDELTAASRVPWVLLSGGVDDETFEAQVAASCTAGASGVVAGRAIWAEAATLHGVARDAFLRTTARSRLDRLARIVEAHAQPWRETRSPLASAVAPAEGWYAGY